MEVRLSALRHKSVGSSSNLSDDELYMEANDSTEDRQTVLGKRKKTVTRSEDKSDSELEDRRSGKEKRLHKDGTEKTMADIQRYRQTQEATEFKPNDTEDDSEMETTKKKQMGKEEEDDFETIVNSVHDKIKKIVKAVNKESGGKIQVTRSDQQLVKDTTAGLLSELVSIIMKQRSLENRLNRCEKESDNAITLRNKTLDEIKRMKMRRIGSEYSEEEMEGKNGRKERRTYAQVSGMSTRRNERLMNDEGKKGKREGTLKGRVVTTGADGWITPPLAKKRAAEKTILVTGKKGQDPKSLVGEIVKGVQAKDIGGLPKAIRTIRDGKVIIVSKDEEQAVKIQNCLGKVDGVESALRRKPLPLIRVSGIEKGFSEAAGRSRTSPHSPRALSSCFGGGWAKLGRHSGLGKGAGAGR